MASLVVVDCSVAAKWILPEPGRASALQLLTQYESGEVSLIAPDLLLAEFASLLAKRHRRKELSAEQAIRAFQLMEQCAPRLVDMRSRISQALELSLRHALSLWDCIYLTVAIEHDCPLLTADLRLFRANTARHPAVRLLQ
jgi:predicted nucleic acid-binding protein